jgi:hypothetical protein
MALLGANRSDDLRRIEHIAQSRVVMLALTAASLIRLRETHPAIFATLLMSVAHQVERRNRERLEQMAVFESR